MNEEIYQLADKALSKMVEGDLRGYSRTELAELIGCSEDVANLVTVILFSRGYAAFPIDEKTKKPARTSGLYLTEKGADFYLSGGFKEIMRREKLMTDNIEASIRTANSQRKIGKITLIVAAITCISIVVQIIVPICFSGKPVRDIAVPINNVKAIENTIDTIPCKDTVTTQFN
jgi:hypothetical protein